MFSQTIQILSTGFNTFYFRNKQWKWDGRKLLAMVMMDHGEIYCSENVFTAALF
jgi:hypothetical protein